MLFLGGISKLVKDDTQALIPKTLTETKIWKDLAKAQLNDEFVPYEINSPLWSDGAAKKRFISVPRGKKVDLDANGKLVFPVGTRFVKMFDLPDGSRRLEARVLVVGERRRTASRTSGPPTRPTAISSPSRPTSRSARETGTFPNSASAGRVIARTIACSASARDS
jgi:hypothetical protein